MINIKVNESNKLSKIVHFIVILLYPGKTKAKCLLFFNLKNCMFAINKDKRRDYGHLS